MEKVAVVILNYKVKDRLLSCLHSVQDSNYKDLEIFVVDNNSGDELEQEIKESSVLHFYQSGANLGYTGGNNIGIKAALAAGAAYILVLNPDTLINPDTITLLLSGLKENQAGIVGPKIYFANSQKIWFAGGMMDEANVLGSHRGVNEQDRGQYDTPQEIDYATGAALFVKREVFTEIGLFDERFFLYYEDSDFCKRARMKGFKIFYIPTASLYHANASSTGLGSTLQDYYITRNRLLYAAKFLSIRTQFALFREALRNLGSPIRRRAWLDFVFGRFGGTFVK
ncbi:hypothetical protein A2631_02965 [Candidatus Daviesbacteria bacterium RIFCSPHIGHO2_01_FULL_44_29]|uniref:Glycosyltransferase 2-like domain-containing protein n=1 Tax=Candidatus Daviesbacteria bacterium RIFCSPHIGHO2_02_FULL_43_12 TaxID=1797776 RepID=A0A1F5KKM9_9BACT|nr:MAG: hypothetical protein A2631_02965 [Candidatus Daviesbacteria bacterium RIFCSPHIGHO2_01_FULL_44_29]OGE40802.1 MAG: hypothetical protein A3E86_02380 [Candidatus Daviesbacteria bacterium RIFCSPHIGHO2_12_FULL_47_45]OGE41345.1 MAG: hypothetical protein A3D25_02360 [Candidatus Daviesbacteria bacterium RIFCSPHIGHO2_02_FULL_43_12]OGE69546.1 MAG: hypothetical protein A3B55_04105 [Candidatus Daviesbacteria bacterium RIFCSPLOWO2_01_FULL_43_15]